MSRDVPRWWPPKVGSALRHATYHGTRVGRTKQIKHVDALLHVVSVFKDKDGEKRIVTAEWFPSKQRWNYEVWWWYQAALGLIWRDGTKKPKQED